MFMKQVLLLIALAEDQRYTCEKSWYTNGSLHTDDLGVSRTLANILELN